jgi:hypothetical protein
VRQAYRLEPTDDGGCRLDFHLALDGVPMDNAMASPILTTGGTGTLGRLVVPRLRDAGGNVRVLSRRSREAVEGIELVTGDLATGEGIDAAVEETGIIVHCAGTRKGDEVKALAAMEPVHAAPPPAARCHTRPSLR